MSAKEIRRQYFCVCEGQQEAMYLRHLAGLLKTGKRVVTFKTKTGKPGDVDKYKYIKYDKAILFDHDGDDIAFDRAINTCVKAKCSCAYSNRNFDLWLLLHKQFFASPVNRNDSYVDYVRKAFALESNADIKEKDVIARILGQISLSDVKMAMNRAGMMRAQKLQEDAKRIGSIDYYDNPDLYIHEFISSVFAECGESMLS